MEKINLNEKSSMIDLKVKFNKALSNKYFKAICKSLDLDEDTLMKYTSSINEAAEEFKNCSYCKGLEFCKNSIKGNMLKAEKNGNGVVLSYVYCDKYKNIAYKKNVSYFDLPLKIKEASISNVYKDDKSRIEILKKMKEFKDLYMMGERPKGIYLYGNFGSGKTYLISALFNDLAKEDVRSVIIHTPELIRSIKDSFDTDYSERFKEVMTTPLLLLDDIGAEYLTGWSRDEVLEPILQYRMDQGLPTFFTSNYSPKELEKHFIINDDKMKAKRIMERINQVSTPIELISENRRV